MSTRQQLQIIPVLILLFVLLGNAYQTGAMASVPQNQPENTPPAQSHQGSEAIWQSIFAQTEIPEAIATKLDARLHLAFHLWSERVRLQSRQADKSSYVNCVTITGLPADWPSGATYAWWVRVYQGSNPDATPYNFGDAYDTWEVTIHYTVSVNESEPGTLRRLAPDEQGPDLEQSLGRVRRREGVLRAVTAVSVAPHQIGEME